MLLLRRGIPWTHLPPSLTFSDGAYTTSWQLLLRMQRPPPTVPAAWEQQVQATPAAFCIPGWGRFAIF